MRNLSTIAQIAGVSSSTVSRALLGRPGVSAKLRAKIKELSIELNIKPQPGRQQARKLRTTYRTRSTSAQMWFKWGNELGSK
jgi:DNA-binding LacI/PurR family transcriptional regulator